MFPRHSFGHDGATTPGHATSHDQLKPLSKFFHKGFQSRKIIAVIGIGHDDIATPSSSDPCPQSAAVAFFRNINDTCPQTTCEFLGTVRASIIRDEHFSLYS